MVSAVVANKLCYLLKCIIYIKLVDLSSDCTIHLQPEASLLFVLPNLKVKVNYFFHMNKLRSIIMIRFCWKRKCQHWRCFLRNWLHLFLNINSVCGWFPHNDSKWLNILSQSVASLWSVTFRLTDNTNANKHVSFFVCNIQNTLYCLHTHRNLSDIPLLIL